MVKKTRYGLSEPTKEQAKNAAEDRKKRSKELKDHAAKLAAASAAKMASHRLYGESVRKIQAKKQARPKDGVLATRELLGELNTVLKKRNPNETITAKDLKKFDSDHSRWKKLLFAATPTEARKMKELMKKWKGK